MNPLRSLFFVACLAAAAFAYPNQQMNGRSNSVSNRLKPTEWLSPSTLQSLPALNEITLQQLENMPLEEGANLIDKMYHLSQINHALPASFTPSPNDIMAYIVKPNGKNVSVSLNQLASAAKQQPNFGDEEVTIFLTGYPQKTHTIRKATRKLVQAYMHRYDAELQQKKAQKMQMEKQGNNKDYYDEQPNTSSEESENQWSTSQKTPTGDLIVIDLGTAYQSFANMVKLNVERTGMMIAEKLLELADEADVPEEIMHIVAQGPSAHVAGVAGRHFTLHNGRPMRRITALDPSKLFAKNPNTLTGLSRGSADFVDAIHTSTYGLGTPTRTGDVDFYPNGPSTGVPGAENVVEAAMRATRYFAESVRPGSERNFPAVAANSLKQYKNQNGHGKRAYMGIATEYDIEGDYMLQVNPKSPFGKNAPAQTQSTYHAARQGWKYNRNGEDYE